MLRVGSDFSGVGAFNQALIKLGVDYEEVFACDNDKFARKTFIHNYGEPKYFPNDVYNRQIPDEPLDLYMTSPPCQAFSLAGLRKGKADKRGIMFFNSLEFIRLNKPRTFIFENVKGLLSHDKGCTFQEWINLLGSKSVNGAPVIFPHDAAVPYHIYWKVINATEFGVPQNRERVFIVGIRGDQEIDFSWPKEEHLTKRLADVLEDNVDPKYYLSDTAVARLFNRNYSKGKINPEIAGTINTKNNSPQCSFDSGTTLISGFGTKLINKNDISPTIISGGTSPQDKVPCIGVVNNNGVLEKRDIANCIDANYHKGIDNHSQRTHILQLQRGKNNGGVHEICPNNFLIQMNDPTHSNNRVYSSEGISPTLRTCQGGNQQPFAAHGEIIRRLTPRECFRLMGYPDSFTWPVSDSQAYKQSGNSIVVDVLASIISKLLPIFNK